MNGAVTGVVILYTKPSTLGASEVQMEAWLVSTLPLHLDSWASQGKETYKLLLRILWLLCVMLPLPFPHNQGLSKQKVLLHHTKSINLIS